jgi:hypothetical protein
MSSGNWISAHWELILGVVYALLNLANGMTKSAEAKSVIGKAIDAVSVLTRAEASGTVKLPLVSSKKEEKVEEEVKNGVHS